MTSPMKRRLASAIVVLAGTCCAAPPAGAVVHGAPVDAASVPWFVSVGSCGGTLVAPARVLTAAHCVAGISAAQLGGVVVGAETRRITDVALHPGWPRRNGPSNFLDDVAVVELDSPVTSVTPVRLGGASVAEALILGRGRPFAPGTGHSETETLDSTLRQAPLRTISDAACARAFRHRTSESERFDPRMRCAIDADGREPLYSGCNGDSGGPLWTGTPAAPIQLGVVSWGGDRCGADHLPSVFADVDRYRGFITDPRPTWAPSGTTTTEVRISGRRRAGATLRCSAPGFRPPSGTRAGYAWRVVGTGRGGVSTPRGVGRSAAYRIRRADRGHRIACLVDMRNAGGYVTVGAANVLVPR